MGNSVVTLMSLLLGLSAQSNFVFSPYKDTSIGRSDARVMGTTINGVEEPVLQSMPSNLSTMTWAFASGACGSEKWVGVDGKAFAEANVPLWAKAGKKYIISTGGEGAYFTCNSDAEFIAFIERYNSPGLVGIDFDIESGETQADVDSLVMRVIHAQKVYPNLRFSFTVGTLAGANPAASLGAHGQLVMNAIRKYGLKNYYINLMAFFFGTFPGNFIPRSDGSCDSARSALQAAINLNTTYGVPFNQIELTIGQGKISGNEVFSIADATVLSEGAIKYGLAGIHFWSYDRDRDCPISTPLSPTCNSYGTAGTLGFTKAFLTQLGSGPGPTPTATPTVTPTATPTSTPSPTPTVPGPESCFDEWVPTKVYVAGDKVSYLGNNYLSNWWNQNADPSKNSGPAGSGKVWTVLGACKETPNPQPTTSPTPGPSPTPTPPPIDVCYPEWSDAKVYLEKDKASYMGVNYVANWWNARMNPQRNSGPVGSGMPWTSIGTCSTGEGL